MMMNRLHGVLASLLLATGCNVGGGYAEAGAAGLGALANSFIEILDTHPASLRASTKLHCDTPVRCWNGGAPGTGCVLSDPAFDPDFAARFASCEQSCGAEPGCFVQAVPPRSTAMLGNPRSDCLAAIADCQVETDACDALAVLRDPAIRDAITACKTRDCDDMQGCYRDALIPLDKIYREADAGSL
jgi:hypothetical protein